MMILRENVHFPKLFINFYKLLISQPEAIGAELILLRPYSLRDFVAENNLAVINELFYFGGHQRSKPSKY